MPQGVTEASMGVHLAVEAVAAAVREPQSE